MKTTPVPAADQSGTKELSFFTRNFGTAYVITKAYQIGGNLAVELVDDNGEPMAALSVNMPEFSHLLRAGEFFAKTWNENEQIAADAL